MPSITIDTHSRQLEIVHKSPDIHDIEFGMTLVAFHRFVNIIPFVVETKMTLDIEGLAVGAEYIGEELYGFKIQQFAHRLAPWACSCISTFLGSSQTSSGAMR
jgi:hypothetical protein